MGTETAALHSTCGQAVNSFHGFPLSIDRLFWIFWVRDRKLTLIRAHPPRHYEIPVFDGYAISAEKCVVAVARGSAEGRSLRYQHIIEPEDPETMHKLV